MKHRLHIALYYWKEEVIWLIKLDTISFYQHFPGLSTTFYCLHQKGLEGSPAKAILWDYFQWQESLSLTQEWTEVWMKIDINSWFLVGCTFNLTQWLIFTLWFYFTFVFWIFSLYLEWKGSERTGLMLTLTVVLSFSSHTKWTVFFPSSFSLNIWTKFDCFASSCSTSESLCIFRLTNHNVSLSWLTPKYRSNIVWPQML